MSIDNKDLFDPETGEPLCKSAEESEPRDLSDPETGEPLGKSLEENGQPDLFDPETGELLGKSVEESGQPDLFDPETGEPLGKSVEESEPRDLFDPETGEPLGKSAEESGQPDLFDPETGEPLGKSMTESRQPDCFDPDTGQPLGSSGKSKAHGKKPVMIGAAAILICLVVVVSAVAGGMFKSKRDIVTDAITEIVTTADDGYMEDTFGIKALKKQAMSGSVQMGIAVDLDDLVGALIGAGSGGTGKVSMDFSRDLKNKAVMLNGSVDAMGVDLGSISLYMDDKKSAAAAPKLSDRVFTFNYADFSKQVDDSYLADLLGIEEQDAQFTSDFLGDTNKILLGNKDYFNISEIYKRYKKTTKAVDNVKKSLKITNADKKTFKVGGRDQKCRGYKVVLPKEALADFVKTTGEFLASDEKLKENEFKYISELLTSVRMLDGESCDDAKDWAENQTDDLLDLIQSGTDEATDFIKDYVDDIEMTVYVDKKGHAVYLSAETKVSIFYGSYKINGEFTFDGGSIPTRNMEGEINIVSNGQKSGINFEKSETNNKESYATEVKYRTSGSKVINQFEYKKKSGEFESKSTDSSGDSRTTFSVKGKVTKHKKGKSLAADIDSISVTGPYDNWSGLSGSFFIKPLSGKVKMPEGKEFDIMTATGSDWGNLLLDIENAVKDLSLSMIY